LENLVLVSTNIGQSTVLLRQCDIDYEVIVPKGHSTSRAPNTTNDIKYSIYNIAGAHSFGLDILSTSNDIKKFETVISKSIDAKFISNFVCKTSEFESSAIRLLATQTAYALIHLRNGLYNNILLRPVPIILFDSSNITQSNKNINSSSNYLNYKSVFTWPAPYEHFNPVYNGYAPDNSLYVPADYTSISSILNEMKSYPTSIFPIMRWLYSTTYPVQFWCDFFNTIRRHNITKVSVSLLSFLSDELTGMALSKQLGYDASSDFQKHIRNILNKNKVNLMESPQDFELEI